MPGSDISTTVLYRPLAHAALVHAQFEAIHPFLDGNGRVGRLITTLLFITRGLLPSPLLYLSAYFEATRDEYYARLLRVTLRGEWEGWLLYFLKGVRHTGGGRGVDRIWRMDDLIVGWKRRLVGSRSRLPERVIDLFAENPYWTIGGVAARLSVAFTTAQRAIERLEKAGIVRQVGEAKRNRPLQSRYRSPGAGGAHFTSAHARVDGRGAAAGAL